MTQDRGVSHVIGMILILTLTIAAMSTVLVLGTATIHERTNDIGHAHHHHEFRELHQAITAVTRGQHPTTFAIGDHADDVSFAPSTGVVSIMVTADNTTAPLLDERISVGTLQSNRGEQSVSLQGGGLWSDFHQNEANTEPQFDFGDDTIRIRLINVTGEAVRDTSIDGKISADSVTSLKPSEQECDQSTALELTVTIESELHKKWNRYFAGLNVDQVGHNPDYRTVTVNHTIEQSTDNSMWTQSDSSNLCSDRVDITVHQVAVEETAT